MQRYKKSNLLRNLCEQCIDIKVVFHIITNQAGTSESNSLSDSVLAEELQILNDRFVGTPFSFSHLMTIRTVNDYWSFVDTYENKDVVDTITAQGRVGEANTANIFYTDGTCTGYSGFASFPNDKGFYPSGMYSIKDRIFMCPKYYGPDETTLAHEFGHWLGLRKLFLF